MLCLHYSEVVSCLIIVCCGYFYLRGSAINKFSGFLASYYLGCGGVLVILSLLFLFIEFLRDV